MRPADSRLERIGATFAAHYYATLVQAPENLAALYTPTAHAVHCFQKASGAAEITELLTNVRAAGVKQVKLEDVSTTRTTSGGIKVTISGQLIGQASPQAFTQEVEMRELESDVFGITSDALSYTVVGQATWAAAETPKAKAVEEPAAAEQAKEDTKAVEEKTQPSKSAQASTIAAAAAAESAPAADAVEPAKKPTSFAEALKMKKMSEGAAFSNKAVRVVASDKTDAPGAAEKAGKAEKKHSGKDDRAAAAKPRATEDSAVVVCYDIILKELSASVTEEEVRALVTPVAAVKLVNVVKSEKRRRSKEAEGAAAPVMAFAFVQLDRPADAPASYVNDVMTKLLEHNSEVQAEVVRERKAPAHGSAGGAKKSADGARGRKHAEHKGKAAAPAKPQPRKAE
ncbi:hypothetical protein ABL78_6215 [Leptomonas seymouri]|uniref:NTF2 domain-containing protein n=1 Tax=Leptomonas seymouri TaxID=5684 RepID=A0A0N1PAH4_LEPSE|nr:hypothetical protein ABL78_6215 [Leptomonas seymouri]|eukprot:KPI84722.1 hypothetical protein ABL78_6215 [Leptomonas seymouri]